MSGTQTAQEEVTRTIPMYNVIFHNDNKTPMDFVVMVLMSYFNHKFESATEIMMAVHEKGQEIAGTYALEVAELKKEQTESLARARKFPLSLSIEPA